MRFLPSLIAIGFHLNLLAAYSPDNRTAKSQLELGPIFFDKQLKLLLSPNPDSLDNTDFLAHRNGEGNVEVVLISREDTAKGVIREFLFLEKTVDPLKAIFLVQSDHVRVALNEMIRQGSFPIEAPRVIVIKAVPIMQSLLETFDSDDDVFAILLVKDDHVQSIVENHLDKTSLGKHVMSVSLSTDYGAVDIIDGILRTESVPEKHPNEHFKIVVLDDDDKVKVAIKGFLNQGDEVKPIRALFLAKDTESKVNLDLLINQEEDEMEGIVVMQYDMVKNILEDVRRVHNVRNLKALLILNDHRTKSFMEQFLIENGVIDQIKLVFVDSNDENQDIINRLLGYEKYADTLLGETNQPAPPKKSHHREGIYHAKKMVEDMLGQDTVVTRLLNSLPDVEHEVRESIRGLLGHDQQLREVIKILEAKNHSIVSGSFRHESHRNASTSTSVDQQDYELDASTYGICETETYKREIYRSHQIIENFTQLLKSFMLESVFDYHGFEARGEDLDRKLSELIANVNKIAICDRGSVVRRAYVQRMFAYMVQSAELLKYYTQNRSPGNHLLSSIIDLNVRLWGLRDSSGRADRSIEGFSWKIGQHVQHINFWAADFTAYKRVPFTMKKLFQIYLHEARGELGILSG